MVMPAIQGNTTNAVPIVLSAADRKAIEKSRRQATNLERIKLANSTRIDEVCTSNVCLDAPPERKPSTNFEDDFRPAINVGEYVYVEEDTSPGQNRQGGYGFITKTNGYSAATLFTVKFSFCVNNQGRTHSGIPLRFITPANFQEGITKIESKLVKKRKRVEQAASSVEELPAALIDTRLPVVKLLDEMAAGSRSNRKRGWYREKLLLRTKGATRLNPLEKQQLYIEILLLDQLNGDKAQAAATRMKTKLKYLKSGKIKSSKRKGIDPTSKRYLVHHAWGLGNSYETKLKR